VNDRTFLTTGEAAAEQLTRIVVWLQTPGGDQRTPIQRNRDGWSGHPKAAAYDRTTPSGHPRHDSGIEDADPDLGWRRTTSDPTGDAAIRPDRAATSRRKVERALKAIEGNLETIQRELAHWAEPRPATDYERRLVEQSNAKPDPGCASCARTEVAHGVDRWEPVYAKDLCRWCWEWERSVGRPATLDELTRHHNGQQIRRPA